MVPAVFGWSDVGYRRGGHGAHEATAAGNKVGADKVQIHRRAWHTY